VLHTFDSWAADGTTPDAIERQWVAMQGLHHVRPGMPAKVGRVTGRRVPTRDCLLRLLTSHLEAGDEPRHTPLRNAVECGMFQDA